MQHIREDRLGHLDIRPVRECVRHHSVRKWKDIQRFEIRYFFIEVGLKPHYILLLSTSLRAPVYSACASILCVQQYVRGRAIVC